MQYRIMGWCKTEAERPTRHSHCDAGMVYVSEADCSKAPEPYIHSTCARETKNLSRSRMVVTVRRISRARRCPCLRPFCRRASVTGASDCRSEEIVLETS
jgi:hypothetical protein